MVYRPTIAPGGLDVDGVRRWTEDEFRNVALGLGDFDALQLNKIVAPAGPLPGMVAYADGVTWNPGSGEGVYVRTMGGLWLPMFDSLPRGYLAGLTLSTAGASASFTCAAGVARDSTNVGDLVLATALTKTTGAWVVGAANGSFDGTGAAPSATAGWYHVHLIKRTDTGVVDVLTSLSATAPTLPPNYSVFRRIGSIKTNGSFQWIGFVQDGDVFQWLTNSPDVAAVNPGVAAVTRTMNTPLGVRVEGIFAVAGIVTTTALALYISDLSVTDEVASAIGPVVSFEVVGSVTQLGVGNQRVFTNTASQIRSRVAASGADLTFYISTRGWVDRRGRDA